MTRRWPGVPMAGVAVACAFVFATSAVETRLVDEHTFRAVGDSAGTLTGPPHVLLPGSYRWRIVAALVPSADRAAPADITHPPIWMGVRETSKDAFDAASRALWDFEFLPTPTRAFDFPLRPRHVEARRLWWIPLARSSAIVPLSESVTRVTPLPAAFRAGTEDRARAGTALLRLLAGLALGLGAAALGAVAASRARRAGARVFGRSAGPHDAVGLALAFGLAGTVLAFGAWTALAALTPDGAIRAAAFPALPDPSGGRPALAALVALVAALGLGAVVAGRSARVWTLVVAAWALSFAAAQLGPRSDFLVYSMAGRSLWGGVNPYPLQTVLNPPPFLLFTIVLAWLPVPLAAFVWSGLKAAMLPLVIALAGFAVTDAYGGRDGSRWARPEWLALLVTGRLVGADLAYGNTNLVVLACLLATAASWRAQHTRRAGAAVVLGIAIKATPGVFALTAALAGRWPWALGVLAAAGAVTGLSALVLEARAPGAGLGFLRYAVPAPHDMALGRVDNQSLRGWLDRLVGGATGKDPAPPSFHAGAVAAHRVELAFLVALAVALWVLGRRAARATPETRDARWADVWGGATLALLLASPGSWTVHFALLYFPVAVLLARARAGQKSAGVVAVGLGLAVTLPAFAHVLASGIAAWSALTLGSLLAVAALLVPPPQAVALPERRTASASMR